MTKIIALFIFSLNLHAGIINSDDRHEVSDAPVEIQNIGKSIAALISKDRVTDLKNGYFSITGLDYIQDYNFCKDESFVTTQKLIANCSASLVGEDKIATAAHCIDLKGEYTIDNYYIVFDYTSEDGKVLSKDSIYEIESMPQHDFNFPNDKDVAILKLKRAVKDRKPLKVSKKRIELGSEIYMLGFPLGLPMKYHDNGFVINSTTKYNGKHSFTHSLDTFSVNSGSSIFSTKTNEIIGILVRGYGANYELDNKAKCNRWGQGDDHLGEANYSELLEI